MTQNDFINYLKELEIEVTEEQLNQLEMYYNLLIEYNKVMNLTGITEHNEVYLKHFYDSLTIAKIIDLNKEKTLCDLGTGAGFPGIVLKIFFPNLKITLVDSLNKRIVFLNTVINKLNLKDIEAIHERIEDYSKKNIEKYDVITARAVAPLNILLEISSQSIKIGKYFIAMKGNIENEPSYKNAIKELNLQEDANIKFKLPFEESNRTLIKIKKVSSTSKLFPRKYNEIKKKPL